MIKFIYFDLGNVLLDFDHQRTIDRVSADTNRERKQVRQVIFESGLQDQYETGLVSCDEFHQAVCDQLGVSIGRDELLKSVADIFTVHTSIIPIVAQLSAVQFNIGVLSNTCRAHWEYVIERFAFVGAFFSDRILSYEQLSMKPDAKIYQAAIAAAKVNPDEIFFMDDRIENVEGAKSAGIDAIQFTTAGQLAAELRERGVRFNY